MPSGKSRSKEDTWKEADLKKALQTDDKKRSKGERKEKERPKDDDRRERRDRDDDGKRRKERRGEDKVGSGDADRRREKEKRRKEDGERERTRDKDKERERTRDGEIDQERQRDRGEKERESERRDRDRERRQERDREKEPRGERRGDKEHRDKEKPRDRDKGRERDRDKEKSRGRDEEGKDEKRRHRERREGEPDKESKRREKDDKGHEKDRSRRKKDEENDSRERKHRDRSSDKRKDRSRDDRERRKNKEQESKPDLDQEDKVRRREKEMLASLKKEEELQTHGKLPSGQRFRADTLEEADAVDEEDVRTKSHRSVARVASSVTNAEEVQEEEAGGYDYEEDDFEDYDEDFEDDNEDDDDDHEDKNGMKELLQAINAENEMVLSREGSKLSKSSEDDSKQDSIARPVTAKGRINFVVAKQKQISDKVASRTRKRGQELMHLIDLDVVAFEMFDLPPMNEYELYIKNFGRSDTKQAYVQCNDDNVDRDIQTEEIEVRTKWTQHPPEDFTGCGDERGDASDPDLSTAFNKTRIDSIRLTQFLKKAGQTCLVLLEEALVEQTNTMFKENKSMACSDGFIQLATNQPLFTGRQVQCVHVSPVQTHLLLTAYGPSTDPGALKMSNVVATKGLVCLWNINEPSVPQKVLVCESVPRCCCLSPSKATLAFAGLDDGSVVAWDLRESSSLHRPFPVGDRDFILRPPTFSTAGVLSQDNHHSPVVSLLPVVMPGDSARASSGAGGSLGSDDMLGLSFQLASLEENSLINIWVVVELETADVAGSESDLGLAPGGKIKLIQSSSLTLESPHRDARKTAAFQTLTMQLLPQDPNHFYIGTDAGYVLHRDRHGGRSPPKAYQPQIECLVDISTLDVSPWQLPCILAGSKDGVLRLYNLKNEFPLTTWPHSTSGSAVRIVRWSRSRPSVFFVLDADSRLHIWDLLQNDTGPVAVERFKQEKIVSFELSSDYTASGIGMPGRTPELALAFESGIVEVHRISAKFSKSSPDELDRFDTYLDAVL